jgi:hypothetical protein
MNSIELDKRKRDQKQASLIYQNNHSTQLSIVSLKRNLIYDEIMIYYDINVNVM